MKDENTDEAFKNMTMMQAEYLFNANPDVKAMHESGDLRKLQEKVAGLHNACTKGYI